jgi:hypothetical protein
MAVSSHEDKVCGVEDAFANSWPTAMPQSTAVKIRIFIFAAGVSQGTDRLGFISIGMIDPGVSVCPNRVVGEGDCRQPSPTTRRCQRNSAAKKGRR